jgi:transposase
VIDSSSIELSRRQRKVKTDRTDVKALLRLLMRYWSGEKEALRAVKVPTVEAEELRRLNRERERLLKERGAHAVRIKSLLVLHGIRVDKLKEVAALIPKAKAAVVGYDLPLDLKNELRRELERHELVDKQVKELEQLQVERAKADTQEAKMINHLMKLKGVGWQSSWVLVMEFFNWREFKNTKQLGACAGLSPTPYDSGNSTKEQGISKAGNRRIRTLMVELSWLWLRYQPKSELSNWFEARFANGGKRTRRIGIVALARKLLVSLWKYVETGEIPKGAALS